MSAVNEKKKILFATNIQKFHDFFRRYFKENFNLRFGRPQIDVCSKCEELGCKVKSSVLNENAKKAAVAELMVHIKRAQKFYQEMKALKDN